MRNRPGAPMLLRALAAFALASALSGCAAVGMVAVTANDGRITGMGQATFPAAMLVRFADGEERLLTGTLTERIDGRSGYTLTGPGWGRCTGRDTVEGRNTVTCADGTRLSFDTGPQGPKMNTVNTAAGRVDGRAFDLAIGWGRSAREEALRAALAGAG